MQAAVLRHIFFVEEEVFLVQQTCRDEMYWLSLCVLLLQTVPNEQLAGAQEALQPCYGIVNYNGRRGRGG